MDAESTGRTMTVEEFSADCLRLIDEAARTGEAIVITKRGKPVARLQAVEKHGRPSLRGRLLWQADEIVSPACDLDDWDALRDDSPLPDDAERRAWLKNAILWMGDVESPATDPDEWEALR